MEKQLQNIICVKCKTPILVKSCFSDYSCKTYKLVLCPNCKTPLREIKSDIELLVKKVG